VATKQSRESQADDCDCVQRVLMNTCATMQLKVGCYRIRCYF